MVGSLSVVRDTLIQIQEEILIASGTHQATGQWWVGNWIQNSKRILPDSCIRCSELLCTSNEVPQRSREAHLNTFKRVDAWYRWLPTKRTHLLLAHSIWHYPTWDKALCFMLETLHQSLQSETSTRRNPEPKTTSKTSPRASGIAVNYRETHHINPSALQSCIPAFGPQPPSCGLPGSTARGLTLLDFRPGWNSNHEISRSLYFSLRSNMLLIETLH